MSIYDHLYKLRSMPELAHKEVKTSSYIKVELEKMGFHVIDHVGGSTGVIGILDSGIKGPVIGIRSDMDALPFEEDGKLTARHSCGHDANMSVGIEASKLVMEHGISTGKFYAVFQPAEEGVNGALSIINSGRIDNIEKLIGVHLVNSDEESGPVGAISPAIYHCAASQVMARYKGVSAHGSKPWEAISALEAAVTAANGIAMIHLPVDCRWSAKTTRINSGQGGINTIPDNVEIGIDLRCDNNLEMANLVSKVKNVLIKAGELIGAELLLESILYGPASELDKNITENLKKVIISTLGEKYLMKEIHTSASEDFDDYAKYMKIKCGYIGVNGHVQKGLHNVEMSYDPSGLDGAARVLANYVIEETNKI